MSESDHQSFYEIQLNTSHLLLVFLGAVVVGVTVFYLGVVIGRGYGTSPALADDWSAAAPVEGAAGDAEDGGAEAGDDELGFYDDIREEAGESGAAAGDTSGAAAPQPAEPGGGGDSAERPASGAAAEGPDPEVPDDAPGATPAGPEEPAAGATEPSTAPQESGSGLPQADPGLESGWVVQVRSTTDRTQADSLTRALVADGYQAFVVSADIDGTTWYRVRVGRYASKADAELVEQRLAGRQDIEQTWVTEG